MGDQSFRALILSLVVHAVFAWTFFRLPSQSETEFLDQPIEIEITEPKFKGGFAMETEKADISPLEKLKDEAELLSLYAKRVREQMRARNTGATKNRPGQHPVEADEQRAKGQQGVAADQKAGRELILPGMGAGPRTGQGSSTFGRQVIVGQSTAGEIIPGIKLGSFTALNTDRFTYYTFFSRINEQVRSRWVRRLKNLSETLSDQRLAELATRDRISEIDIQLDKNGLFVRAVVLRSSGAVELDNVASDSFEDAAPFPNPPQEMVEEDGLIHLRYTFLVQTRPSVGG